LRALYKNKDCPHCRVGHSIRDWDWHEG
jgi:hypothetical protein